MTPTPPEPTPETNFEADLKNLINRYSKENGSNTPDFILAKHLSVCLGAFDSATKEREAWYGRDKAHPSPASAEAAAGEIAANLGPQPGIETDDSTAIILRHCSAHLAPALQGGEANEKLISELSELEGYLDNHFNRHGAATVAQAKAILSQRITPPQPLREVIERAKEKIARTLSCEKGDPIATDLDAALALLTALTPLLAHDKRSDGERSDKERLDWLEKHWHDWNKFISTDSDGWCKRIGEISWSETSVRSAIDAALAAQTEGKK